MPVRRPANRATEQGRVENMEAHQRYVDVLRDPEHISGQADEQLLTELPLLADLLDDLGERQERARTRRDRICRALMVRGHERQDVATAARVTSSAVGQSVKALNRRETDA